LLQRLRRITDGRNATSISGSNCRRENIISKNILHHSDLQHNHDTYFNLTNLGGRQTPATLDSTTDINERSVIINDNARNSSTCHSHNLFAHTQRTSNILYDSLNADMMQCEQKSPCSTPNLSKSAITTGRNLIVSKGLFRPDHQTKRVLDGDGQPQRNNESQNTNTRCKPTYVHFTFPQISVKRNSSSAEIIL
jgi:hypothetical protein